MISAPAWDTSLMTAKLAVEAIHEHSFDAQPPKVEQNVDP